MTESTPTDHGGTHWKPAYIKDSHGESPRVGLVRDQPKKARRKLLKSAGFTMVWMNQLLTLPPLSWNAVRTLAALCVLSDTRQRLTVTYTLKQLCVLLDETDINLVSRRITELVKADTIVRVQRGEVMMNPAYLWIGTPESRSAAFEYLDQLRGTNTKEDWNEEDQMVSETDHVPVAERDNAEEQEAQEGRR